MSAGPDVDVVVIGAGGAGLAAAVSAGEQGASVLVVEAGDHVGGSTALAGGSFMAAGTPQQAELGFPDDSVNAFLDHYLTFNRWDVEPGVALRFCENARPTMDWLVGLGVRFPVEGLYRATREAAPRSHRPEGGGAAIVAALHRRARDLRVDIALGTRVDRLELGTEAHVVHAGDQEISARAIVVATGGFGANPDLIREHIPDAEGNDVWSPSAETCRGDGLRIAAAVGAEATGRNRADVLLSAGLVKEIEPYPPSWLVIVGRQGRRVVDEGAPYAVLTPIAVTNAPCWVILDQAMVRTAKADSSGTWGSGTWNADVLQPAIDEGKVLTADTIEDLAVEMGVPPENLAATIRRYNGHCSRGKDVEFLKAAEGLVPFTGGPFHAVRLHPSVVALTGYGLRIDPDTRVLAARDGEPLPRLYAAGEVTGNVIGPQYLGGGNAIGSALIFGRIAGRQAAADREAIAAGASR